MAKEYVPIFFDWLDLTRELTAEERGNLIDAVVAYASGGEKEIDPILKPLCGFMLERYVAFNSFPNGKPTGQYHWNWKGGKTPENQRDRSSKKYADWRKAVFLRDNFTCQMCGQVGGGLNAHHIKRWSTNVNERYQVSNGITLCEKCHKELHGKGVK